MGLKNRLWSARNYCDFKLRGLLSIPGPSVKVAREEDAAAAKELAEFLDIFSWETYLAACPKQIRVADIGARNFFLASVIDQTFRKRKFDPEVHGIEVDAFRRYQDFRLRAQYGKFYAKQIDQGFFHAKDFLNFNYEIDVALLLNPFVSEEPLLQWGLPLSLLSPPRLFAHVHKLLKPRNGLLLISSPSDDELEESKALAAANGFTLLARQDRHSKSSDIQSHPRLGSLFRCQ